MYKNNPVSTYTSTGEKLLFHPDVVKEVLANKKASPVSLQIAPTSECNLNCSFCSNTNRERNQSLSFIEIGNILSNLTTLGLRTVEWTGGGDPTMYGRINEVISLADRIGLKQGLITNGVLLKEKLTKDSLSKLYWVRISLNCLDYVNKIDIPEIKGILGFSYVMNDRTDSETIEKIKTYIAKYNPAYVRVVPNCQSTHEEQMKNNAKLAPFVKGLGSPWFFQPKVFCKPSRCYWGYFKPFLLHDGWVYPCSSVVLNDAADRKFNEKYRWYYMDDLVKIYNRGMESFPTRSCTHCVFSEQNNMVDNLLHPSNMIDFV